MVRREADRAAGRPSAAPGLAISDLNSTIFKPKAQRTGQQQKTRRGGMKSKRMPAVVIIVVSLAVTVLAVLGGRATSAQDTAQAKYTVRVPNGLAFSEFRGYEGWQTVSISRNEKLMAVIRCPECRTGRP